MLFFWTFCSSKNAKNHLSWLKKYGLGKEKKKKKRKKIIEHQISMLKWFLQDHVTQETGVMAAENSALTSHW